MERAKQEPHELSGVLCKEFNVRGTVKTAWLSFQDIDNPATFDLADFRGAYCIGGVDLSITTDLTCASLLTDMCIAKAQLGILEFYVYAEYIPVDEIAIHLNLHFQFHVIQQREGLVIAADPPGPGPP